MGKSDILNNIFFTNFCFNQNKHRITCKVPYIAIRVYEDLFPLNIIDIPHDCDQKIIQKIIGFSDVILLNSWKD